MGCIHECICVFSVHCEQKCWCGDHLENVLAEEKVNVSLGYFSVVMVGAYGFRKRLSYDPVVQMFSSISNQGGLWRLRS